jgi:ABC-2 type transport system permease protein
MQIIFALWSRQLKRYLRSKSRIVGALGQPLLYLFALGFGLGPVFQRAGNGNYLQFLVPGIIAQSIIFTSIFSGIEVIWDRQFGFLKETLIAPVSRFEIMLGRTLGGATVATFQGTIVLAIASLFGFRMQNIFILLPAILCMFLIALLFTSLGTAIASMLDDMHGFQLILNFLVMPLFFLSGALFPLKDVPLIFKIISSFDPLTYGVDALRGLFIGTSQVNFSLDILVLCGLTTIFLVIGSYLFSKIQV